MVKKFRRHVVFVTSLLIIFVFFGGFLLGRNIAGSDVQGVTEFIKENELNTESYLIERDLIDEFGTNNCELASLRISQLSDELAAIGRMLEEPDAIEKLGSGNFEFLKIKFHLMQIKTYTLFKKMIDSCDLPENVILYYYSLDDEDCEEQGHVLDRIVEEHGANIFAIEYGYADELKFLEEYHEIDRTPTLIINYKIKKEGLTDYERIEENLK
jgi:hypothetical protein